MYQASAFWHHMQNEVERQYSPAAAIARIAMRRSAPPGVWPGRMASERAGAAEGADHGLGVVAFAIDLANDGRELTRRQIAHRLDHIHAGGRIGVILCCNPTIEHGRAFG